MKKQIKKLSLNKKTISNLNRNEMNKRIGGASDFCSGCLFCPTNTTCSTGPIACPTHACVTQACATQQGQATCYKHGHTC